MSHSIHMLRIQINPINFELFNNIKLSFLAKWKGVFYYVWLLDTLE